MSNAAIDRLVDVLTLYVAGEPTQQGRFALYERARTLLISQLRSLDPPVPFAEMKREHSALEEAILAVEVAAVQRSLFGRNSAAPVAVAEGLPESAEELPESDRLITQAEQAPDVGPPFDINLSKLEADLFSGVISGPDPLRVAMAGELVAAAGELPESDPLITGAQEASDVGLPSEADLSKPKAHLFAGVMSGPDPLSVPAAGELPVSDRLATGAQPAPDIGLPSEAHLSKREPDFSSGVMSGPSREGPGSTVVSNNVAATQSARTKASRVRRNLFWFCIYDFALFALVVAVVTALTGSLRLFVPMGLAFVSGSVLLGLIVTLRTLEEVEKRADLET
jgi:hypothetical protein